MDINIQIRSEIPIYRQIYEQVSGQIVRGELPGDYCLPSIRTIALELRTSVITIKKAWDELERDGFIYTVLGKGCFVAPAPPEKLRDRRDELASLKLSENVRYCKELGLSLAEIQELVKKHYRE